MSNTLPIFFSTHFAATRPQFPCGAVSLVVKWHNTVEEFVVSLAELKQSSQGQINALITRALDGQDLLALANPQGTEPPPLKKIKETHHRLARLLASGLKPVEVAAITGFTQSRISILKNDPAFQELLAHYANTVESKWADMHEQLAGVSLDVLHELRDRLHDSPESMSTDQLMKFLDSMLDRTGYGVQTKSKNENLNLTLTPDQLAQIKTQTQESSTGHAIKQTFDARQGILGATPEPSQGERLVVGGTILDGPELEKTPLAGGAGEGEGV